MRFLGIDAGASFLKGAILDIGSARLERVIRTPFPGFIPGLPASYRETDPRQILVQVSSLIDRLLAGAPPCDGLVLCGQMHGLVLMSPAGAPLSNFISWQDERAAEFYLHLQSRLDPGLCAETGNEIRANLPVGVLFAMRESGQLPDEAAIPCSLPDFILASLCNARPVTDATNASAHGCYDIRRGTWHREILEAAGLNDLRFPEIVPTGAEVGRLPAKWGSLPCFVAAGDQQTALLGAGLEPGELSLNISTGSQVSMLSRSTAAGAFQLRPYFDGYFLRTVTHIPAGRSLNLLLRLLCELQNGGAPDPDQLWSRLDRAVQNLPATTLRANLSFFSGAMGDSGSVSNIREDNFSAAHLFRAAIDSMADNYAHCAERISPTRDWTSILFSGGLVQKLDSLRCAILSRFDSPHRLPPSSEDTLHGLSRLARQCVAMEAVQ